MMVILQKKFHRLVQPDKIKEAPDLQWITTKVFGICIYANRSR